MQNILVKAFFSFHITKNVINVQYVTIYLDLSENPKLSKDMLIKQEIGGDGEEKKTEDRSHHRQEMHEVDIICYSWQQP